MFSVLLQNLKDIVYDVAWMLWDSFFDGPHPIDLTIHHAQRVLPMIPQDSTDYAIVINGLGHILFRRFRLQGNAADLADALTYLTIALDLQPPGHSGRASTLVALALAIYSRFESQNNQADLDNAIAFFHEALASLPREDPTRPVTLARQAAGLYTRFKRNGNIVDLNLAIHYQKVLLELSPPGNSMHIAALAFLAELLNERFGLIGHELDMYEAISILREFVPADGQITDDTISNLLEHLDARFSPENPLSKLNKDLEQLTEELESLGPGDSARLNLLRKLGKVLMARSMYGKMSDVTDLDKASQYYREVLDLLPATHPERRDCLSLLGSVASLRYSFLHEAEDIKNAIQYHNDALRSSTLVDAEHPLRVYELGSDYLSRFNQSDDPADLDNAIFSLREANTSAPKDHHVCMFSHCLLSKAYTARYDLAQSQYDMDQAFYHFAASTNQLAFPPSIRFQASVFWVTEARRLSHCSLLDAYTSSLQILDCHVPHSSPDLFSQFESFSHSSGIDLACDAAALAIDLGDIERAVEFLEQGRSRIWSRMRSYRSSMKELRRVNRTLGDEFDSLSRELDANATSFRREYFKMNYMHLSLDNADRKYYDLLAKWQSTLDRIRGLENFSQFLKASSFHVLRNCAVNGPVIIVNHSQYRSDAIIIHATAPPQHIPLQNVLPSELENHATSFWNLVQSADADRSRGAVPVLRYLWEVVVQPIIEELDVTEHERIWWCPTSHFCYLPLHAAGPYRRGSRNLPDLVVSSYTPTLSALITASIPVNQVDDGKPPRSLDDHTDANGASCSPNKTLLAVGQPETQGEAKLEWVGEEFRRIQQITNDCTILMGEQGTYHAVLCGLQKHPWVHLTCHGHLDLENPFTSCFALHDTGLSLSSIVQEKLPNAEFAFLSACHSAGGDPNTPDEILHLAAGMQFAGFRSVVGTMWAMADVDGPTVVEEFYRNMFDENGEKLNHRNAAKALNLATKEMRRKGVPLDRWINFIHIGA